MSANKPEPYREEGVDGRLLRELRRVFPARGGSSQMEIGEFSYGNPQVKSWGESAVLRIGKFCSIAENVTVFLGGEHRTDWVTTYPFSALIPRFAYIEGHPKSKGDVSIGNDVWIAEGATILSGVRIGDGAVVGAKAVVTKDVLPYTIVAGNPAQTIRSRFSPDIVARLLDVRWWDWSLERIEPAIPLLLSSDMERFLEYAESLRLED